MTFNSGRHLGSSSLEHHFASCYHRLHTTGVAKKGAAKPSYKAYLLRRFLCSSAQKINGQAYVCA